MKIVIKTICTIVLSISALTCSSFVLAADKREHPGLVRVGIDTIGIPYSYIADSNNKPYTFYVDQPSSLKNDKNVSGFDVDLFNEIARIQNIKFVYKIDTFNNLLNRLESGDLDVVISGVTITRERESKFLFTTPYLSIPMALCIRKENEDKYGSVEKIDGHVVCTKSNNTGTDFATEHLKYSTIKQYSSYVEALELVDFGLCAGTFTDAIVAQAYVDYAEDLNIKIIPLNNYVAQSIGIAVNKNRPTLLKKIQIGLDRVKNTGKIKELSLKYFHNLSYIHNPPTRVNTKSRE